jgi:hypothetical protein
MRCFRKSRRPRSVRPAVQQLEDRMLLSTTITFDDLAPGTSVSTQYLSKGVEFLGQSNGGAFLPVVQAATSQDGVAPLPHLLANISGTGEFPVPDVVGRFPVWRQHVAVSVGEFAAPLAPNDTAQLTLLGYDNNHNLVAQAGTASTTAATRRGTVIDRSPRSAGTGMDTTRRSPPGTGRTRGPSRPAPWTPCSPPKAPVLLPVRHGRRSGGTARPPTASPPPCRLGIRVSARCGRPPTRRLPLSSGGGDEGPTGQSRGSQTTWEGSPTGSPRLSGRRRVHGAARCPV